MLGLMPIYNKIKNETIRGLWPEVGVTLRPPPETKYFCREFYHRKKAKVSDQEKQELVVPHLQPKSLIEKKKEFLSKLFEYSSDFFDYHKWRMRTAKQRAKNSKIRYEWLLKSDVSDREVDEKERLDALKEKRFEDYAGLLTKAKKERII